MRHDGVACSLPERRREDNPGCLLKVFEENVSTLHRRVRRVEPRLDQRRLQLIHGAGVRAVRVPRERLSRGDLRPLRFADRRPGSPPRRLTQLTQLTRLTHVTQPTRHGFPDSLDDIDAVHELDSVTSTSSTPSTDATPAPDSFRLGFVVYGLWLIARGLGFRVQGSVERTPWSEGDESQNTRNPFYDVDREKKVLTDLSARLMARNSGWCSTCAHTAAVNCPPGLRLSLTRRHASCGSAKNCKP